MNKSEVYAEYNVDSWGVIHSPGKFEGESWIAPIIYDWYGNGDRGEEIGDPDNEYPEGSFTSIYVLDADSRAILELDDEPEVYAVTLDESDQGFVYVGTLTRAEYDQAVS